MRVLVLGANGFIGRAAINTLSQRSDLELVAAVRSKSPGPDSPAVEVRTCDALHRASMRSALDGVTHAINCVMGSGRVMFTATTLLTELAVELKLSRIIHLSSIAVFGGMTGVLNEESAPSVRNNAYGTAKIACERVTRSAAEFGVRSVILRPGCVYGPGGKAWTLRLGQLLVGRRLGDLGSHGDGSCNLIYIADVAAAIEAALELDTKGAEAFNLAEASPPTWNWYLKNFARAIGAVPVAYVPAWKLQLESRLAAPPLAAMQRLTRNSRWSRKLYPVTPSLVRLFAQEICFDPRKVDEQLRLRRTALADGLTSAAQWYRAQVTA
ncbi:MAG TPA: NAD(P)-dependent oxidoreductase [Rhizomicrobium sp.]|jgi:nucleoside-diphosphate-sugar epimerase|nr:NAD(P)-dependent oxidoreductase [Rhizomicrobium sp.]